MDSRIDLDPRHAAVSPWAHLETGLHGSLSVDLVPGRYRVAATLAGDAVVTREIELLDINDDKSFVIEP